MTAEGHNTPVSAPSGPSAGLEGQDATRETQDATGAAQGRVDDAHIILASVADRMDEFAYDEVSAAINDVLDRAEAAEARVAELEVTVARGLALADEWAAIDGDGMTIPWPVADSLMHKAAADLRASLDAPKDTTAP